MITVTVNGEPKQLAADKQLLTALQQWQLDSQSFAVAVNQQFIPKAHYATTNLKQGDEVELLVPMQGG